MEDSDLEVGDGFGLLAAPLPAPELNFVPHFSQKVDEFPKSHALFGPLGRRDDDNGLHDQRVYPLGQSVKSPTMSAVASPNLDWDMKIFFPSADSPEFAAAKEELKQQVAKFENALESGSIDRMIETLTEVSEHSSFLFSYLHCLVSANTRDDAAQAQLSEMETLGVELNQLMTRFTAWVGDQEIESLVNQSELARAHEYILRKAKVKATRLMSPKEEALAAELGPAGTLAWAKFHGNFTSQIEVEFNGKTVGMAQLRNVAYDGDRAKRKAAYELELATWKKNETPCAASMNGIKGAVNTLSAKRGWGSGLNQAIFDNAIDRESLDAMMAAAKNSFPDWRRYLKAKARALGIETLEWYDLFAPLGSDGAAWPIDKGCDFVAEQFDSYSQKMGDFARRSFRENWIDWNPKLGKVGGAFCSGMKDDVSRILMNYDGSFTNVKTLAHELGHAYHQICTATRPVLLRDYPSTLAETASIFCETIIKNAAMRQFEGAEKVALLEACLLGPCQTVVDITSRFLFEQAVFEKRHDRDLSANELCDLMLQAQKDTYGEGLASYHPYMWAAKPHYYDEASFYNFPYMFGLLFGLGLYKVYQQDPNGFKDRYDDLLASCGSSDAPELCARFDIDTRDIEFWTGSLDVLRADIAAFEAAV